jgi:hypothetical protein
MKNKFKTFLCTAIAFIMLGGTASATPQGPYTPIPKKALAPKNIKKPSNRAEENRQRAIAEYKKWQKLPETEKLVYIEKERQLKLKEGEARWNKLSPVKKIENQEKAFQRQMQDPKIKQQQAASKLQQRCQQVSNQPMAAKAANTKPAPKKSVYSGIGKP